MEGSQTTLSFRREHGGRSQMLGEQLLHKKEADSYKVYTVKPRYSGHLWAMKIDHYKEVASL